MQMYETARSSEVLTELKRRATGEGMEAQPGDAGKDARGQARHQAQQANKGQNLCRSAKVPGARQETTEPGRTQRRGAGCINDNAGEQGREDKVYGAPTPSARRMPVCRAVQSHVIIFINARRHAVSANEEPRQDGQSWARLIGDQFMEFRNVAAPCDVGNPSFSFYRLLRGRTR
jgi:hypothetical protein